MKPTQATSFSYSVFSLVLDDVQERTIPVGVALWSSQSKFVKFKFIDKHDKLTGLNASTHLPFVRLVRDKVSHWINIGKLPYSDDAFAPFDDRWWRHARKLLIHQVRLSEPRPIDCVDPADELDPLFESVVSAFRPMKASRSRIDGQIRKCLDDLSKKFKSRQPVPGFGGREVLVLRAYRGKKGWVVIEGINLASNQAETQSDATASRLQRIQRSLKDECVFLIGYIASPEGINGEGVLVEWLQDVTGARTFDLLKQRPEFHDAAQDRVDVADGVKSPSLPSSVH